MEVEGDGIEEASQGERAPRVQDIADPNAVEEENSSAKPNYSGKFKAL